MQTEDTTPSPAGGHVCSTGELGRTIADELRALAEDGSKVHRPGMPEHTLCRGVLALLKENERLRGIVPEVLERLNDELCAENERLRALLARCRPIIDGDAQMMDDIRRHAPLSADTQAIHDAMEYDSERLSREITAIFGPNFNSPATRP